MYDASGNAIPIRWLAPECVELSDDDDEALSLKSITKECNLWLVHSADCNVHIGYLPAVIHSFISTEPVSYTHLTLPTKRIV